MGILSNFLSSNTSKYLRLIIGIVSASIIGFIVAQKITNTYVAESNFKKLLLNQKIRDKDYFYKFDSLQIELNKSKTKLFELLKTIKSSNTDINPFFSDKLINIESKLDSLTVLQNALRQAINPINPEEILTIARLKDELIESKKDIASFEENFKTRQQAFEESVRRENESSNKSTTLILVVLVPLV